MTAKSYNAVVRRNMEKRRLSASRRGKYGNEVKARLRIERARECGSWTNHKHVFEYSVSPCGRYIALTIDGRWARCGSERYLRGVLAKAIWRKTK